MTKSHHVFPGSLQIDDSIVKAGVHVGDNAYTPKDLRYVQFDMNTIEDKKRTLENILGEVYDNSTGCLINGNFKMNLT